MAIALIWRFAMEVANVYDTPVDCKNEIKPSCKVSEVRFERLRPVV